jgi:hypothetical protein
MSSSSATSGINTSTSSRNTSRLTATSSDQLTLEFIKRALTPKAIWTHKVIRIFILNSIYHIFFFKGRIS